MAKRKTTVTVDQRKVDEARRLVGAVTTSAAIDIALDRLIRTERLRADVLAYTSQPPTDAEIALAAAAPSWSDLADDTDWESVFSKDD